METKEWNTPCNRLPPRKRPDVKRADAINQMFFVLVVAVVPYNEESRRSGECHPSLE
jgi:hypothetical protein